jgi:hypothetical protein
VVARWITSRRGDATVEREARVPGDGEILRVERPSTVDQLVLDRAGERWMR